MRTLLKLYVEHRGLGEILSEVWAMRLDARTVFMPDICYFTTGQVAALTPTHARFAPRMVVEVLSQTTGDRDVGPKFAAYEHHEVEEYWVLDPTSWPIASMRGRVSCWSSSRTERRGIASRAIPGFWVARERLDPEALPPVLECLERSLSETS